MAALTGAANASTASAQEDARAAAWTYRAGVTDEITAARSNADSPFAGQPATTLWNPSNLIVAIGDGSWTPSDRVHAAAGVAVLGATGGDAALRVREAYVRISAASWLDIESGKRLARWGTGYAFTPTGLLDPPRDATDPQDRLGLNEGMAIAQAVLFRGETALTVAAAAPQAWRSARADPARLLAVKLRTAVRGFEFALVGSAADGRRFSSGANFTHVVGRQLEWHGELLRHDRVSPWDARLDPGAAGARTVSALIGLQYTSPGGMNVVFEAYRDGNGLGTAQWQRLVAGARATLAEPSPAAEATMAPRPSRKDFVFLRAARASTTARWKPELTTIAGVDDGSVTIVPSLSWTARDHVELYVRGIALAGAQSSEAREAPVHATVMLGASVRY